MTKNNNNKNNNIDEKIIESQTDEHLNNAGSENEKTDFENEATIHKQRTNTFLQSLIDENFIEYASYVVKERAIPDIDDGLKPVQRRILWSLFQTHDGKFHKVANIIGHTMQYHPHGDASIGAALIVLANKEYYIEKQGNFGNIFTGDAASAARYIECRLSPLAKEVLFNKDITEFIDSYDGRNKEPLALAVKVPSLLMLGTEGIAVGMSTKILPHNFKELLEAQISVINNEDFEIYPDFIQGGRMDVSEYDMGNGKVTIRAKIERHGRNIVIREIPYGTTTESIIASIERAVQKNKIKLSSINDYTGEDVEIEITPKRGHDPSKVMHALFAYTDCSFSISVNMMVIQDGKPVLSNVNDVIRRNTEKLLEYLRCELEIELAKLKEMFHQKTLEQIFIENKIYKKIEECETQKKVFEELRKGLEKFIDLLEREITDEDITRLLAIPIRRISKFDINKNKSDIEAILKDIDKVQKHLKRLKSYAKKYLKNLIRKYGELYPRRTEIDELKSIDKRKAALNNIKVSWDKKNCYIGTNVKSENNFTCNEYDHLLCIEKKGKYRVINIPDKIFIGRLYDFRKYDKDTEFGIIYKEKKSGKCYAKRSKIDKFITDKEYRICPKGSSIELITTRLNSVYECELESKRKVKPAYVNFIETPSRSAGARGLLVSPRKVKNIKFVEFLEDELEDPNSEENKDNSPNEKDEQIKSDENKSEKSKNKKEKTPVKKKSENNIKTTSEKKNKSEKSEKKYSSEKNRNEKKTLKKADKNNSEKSEKKDSDDKDDNDFDLGIRQPNFDF